TSTAHRLHHGTRLLRGLRAAKLRRLGLDATPEMVAEVHRRVALVHEIERLTDPTQQPVMSTPQADMSAPETGHDTGHGTGHGPDIGADTAPDMSGQRQRTSPGVRIRRQASRPVRNGRQKADKSSG